MKEIQGKSTLLRVSEGSSYRESTVFYFKTDLAVRPAVCNTPCFLSYSVLRQGILTLRAKTSSPRDDFSNNCSYLYTVTVMITIFFGGNLLPFKYQEIRTCTTKAGSAAGRSNHHKLILVFYRVLRPQNRITGHYCFCLNRLLSNFNRQENSSPSRMPTNRVNVGNM